MVGWCYGFPYDDYNLDADKSHEISPYLVDPKNDFWAILNRQGELEGFCSFGADGQASGGDYSAKALDIGIGIRSDLVGRGRGKQYAQAVAEQAMKKHRAQQLRVMIAAFTSGHKKCGQT
ncbi:hypothetical protein C8255_11050 [filamentous cyanobacterium CCP3]|nr:hypothetical protein C8255_11050 [filamentous cyanobacterium CCP3]